MRYRHGLLYRVLSGWRQHTAIASSQRAEGTLRALAMISGKRETPLLYRLKAWKAWTLEQKARKGELAAKALGRYRNQLAAKCLMAWSLLVHHARQELDGKMLRALAFLSGKEMVLLKLTFQALRKAIAQREDER